MDEGCLIALSYLRETKSNNGMHPTADTLLVINLRGAARRVMPGVRLLALNFPHKADYIL